MTKNPIVSTLIKSLSLIYKTDNIKIDNETVGIIVESGIDNKSYTINDDNFVTLSTVICEMVGINKEDIAEVKPKEEMSEIELEFEKRRKKYLEMQNNNKNKKSEGYTILDIANIVIHFSGLSYNEVFNMTIYQLKNSFKILMKKDSYTTNLLHRISQKFDTSKEKFVHWTDEVKLDISSLNFND